MRSLHRVQWLQLARVSQIQNFRVGNNNIRLSKAKKPLKDTLESALLAQGRLVLEFLQGALRLGARRCQQYPKGES